MIFQDKQSEENIKGQNISDLFWVSIILSRGYIGFPLSHMSIGIKQDVPLQGFPPAGAFIQQA
ncbi:hypothetical protein AMQ68_21805 [Chryseobacterium sp. ERMR1:04]|nr:hypothetical protein AMQ68_21805 [Chryseobacterium sp. ERMR1:04]